MHYVMQRDTKLAGKFAYFEDEPDGYEGGVWRTGEEMKQPDTPMTLISSDERTNKLSDMILNAADLQVYSPKFIQSLESAGVDNIQYFPIKIVDALGKKTNDYKVANILGRISCVDKEHASISYLRSGNIGSVEEFKILEAKVKKAPLIFRLDESEFIVLAHESIKKAFERDGITGVKFTKTEDFVG